MHNNVKFVLRDEDIQVWWGQLVFRFILGVGVCAFPHVLGMEKSKKLPPTPVRIISGTALSSLFGCCSNHYSFYGNHAAGSGQFKNFYRDH